MSLNFSNFYTKKKQIKGFSGCLNKLDLGNKAKASVRFSCLRTDDNLIENEDYSKMNTISFKQSFTKLQVNYFIEKK